MDMVHSAVDSWQRERGLDHKSQAGTLGSAATAAKAMGLSAEKTTHALALAMDMACGTEQYVWDAGSCDTKDLLAGYGARNGINAAKMADFGFRGPPGALDGEYGYFHAFGPGYDPAFLDALDGEALGAHRLQTARRLPTRPLLRRRHARPAQVRPRPISTPSPPLKSTPTSKRSRPNSASTTSRRWSGKPASACRSPSPSS